MSDIRGLQDNPQKGSSIEAMLGIPTPYRFLVGSKLEESLLEFEVEENRMSYLIKDTTEEERKQIVEESLGNISASCDGCSIGIIEMYQPYIDGLKELRDINMEFRTGYVSGSEVPERGRCL